MSYDYQEQYEEDTEFDKFANFGCGLFLFAIAGLSVLGIVAWIIVVCLGTQS